MIRLLTGLRNVAFALLFIAVLTIGISRMLHGDLRLAEPLLPVIWGFLAIAVIAVLAAYAVLALRRQRGG